MNAQTAREIWNFNPDTGVFTWKIKPAKRVQIGDAAGSLDGEGYVLLAYKRRRYRAHRIAWLWFHGSLPVGEIDHINHRRSDNRIANLRDVSRKQNAENTSVRRKGAVRGVYWFAKTSKWVAHIKHKGKQMNLGYYHKHEDAVAARRKAEDALYTSHVR